MTRPRSYPLVSTVDAGQPGSALAALNPLMAAFVVAKVQTGQHNARCAALAGYRGSAATLKATGYRLAHDPRVQAALHEQCALAIKSSAATAVRVIEDVASDPRAEPKDRLRAAAMILDRSGLSAVTQHQITVDHRSEQDKVDLIVELAARLGIDPRQLLGQAGVAIDAEFKLIEPPGASTATQAERLTR